MEGTVNKQVRFVNIITDISQSFVDIYQSVYANTNPGIILWWKIGMERDSERGYL